MTPPSLSTPAAFAPSGAFERQLAQTDALGVLPDGDRLIRRVAEEAPLVHLARAVRSCLTHRPESFVSAEDTEVLFARQLDQYRGPSPVEALDADWDDVLYRLQTRGAFATESSRLEPVLTRLIAIAPVFWENTGPMGGARLRVGPRCENLMRRLRAAGASFDAPSDLPGWTCFHRLWCRMGATRFFLSEDGRWLRRTESGDNLLHLLASAEESLPPASPARRRGWVLGNAAAAWAASEEKPQLLDERNALGVPGWEALAGALGSSESWTNEVLAHVWVGHKASATRLLPQLQARRTAQDLTGTLPESLAPRRLLRV